MPHLPPDSVEWGRPRRSPGEHSRPAALDASVVRTWCRLSLQALGRAREDIDAINVYPVPDGDTGTNLYLTLESAAEAVDAVTGDSAAEALQAMSHGALVGALGNSGTILAQLLRGMTDVLTGGGTDVLDGKPADGDLTDGELTGGKPAGGDLLGPALRRAAELAYQAVAHPVEGTMLTVARAAAEGAEGAQEDNPAAVAEAAYDAARRALAATTGQLEALAQAGVVDAGGRGLVAVLGAFADALAGCGPSSADPAPPAGSVVPYGCAPGGDGTDPHLVPGGPGYEVVYLLQAPDSAVPGLRDRLDALGDCLVVVGGDGLWNIHVHADDVGAAIEAGIEAGRPYRVKVTHFGDQARSTAGQATERGAERTGERRLRAVVAVVRGEGLAALCAEAGATVVTVRPGLPPDSTGIADAIRRAHAREVVLLPNDADLRYTAGLAADAARAEGVRVAVIPTRSAVQGIAALAVHEPSRRFDEDVVTMTSAAGATRYAELAVAERQSWTMAGVCQAGDTLGLIDGDVAVIGGTLADTATVVLDRMLAAGGEMVTLVLGAAVPADLADRLRTHVHDTHLAVDTVVYHGGQTGCPLLIGVE